MFNYLKLADAPGLFLTEIAFISTLASWGYWRLYSFPVNVIYKATLPWVYLWSDNPQFCEEKLMDFHNLSLVDGHLAYIPNADVKLICDGAKPVG